MKEFHPLLKVCNEVRYLHILLYLISVTLYDMNLLLAYAHMNTDDILDVPNSSLLICIHIIFICSSQRHVFLHRLLLYIYKYIYHILI